MSYNFDPERWHEDARRRLDLQRQTDGLTENEYEQAREELERRYERLVARLEGTFQLDVRKDPS